MKSVIWLFVCILVGRPPARPRSFRPPHVLWCCCYFHHWRPSSKSLVVICPLKFIQKHAIVQLLVVYSSGCGNVTERSSLRSAFIRLGVCVCSSFVSIVLLHSSTFHKWQCARRVRCDGGGIHFAAHLFGRSNEWNGGVSLFAPFVVYLNDTHFK